MGLLRHVELGKGERLVVPVFVGVCRENQDDVLNDHEYIHQPRIVLDATTSPFSPVYSNQRLAPLHNCLAIAGCLGVGVSNREDRTDVVAFAKKINIPLGPTNVLVELPLDQASDLVMLTALAVAQDSNIQLEENPQGFRG